MVDSLQTWFAHPALLVGLAVVPLLTACFVVAYFLRRRALARLGSEPSVRRLALVNPAGRRWRALCALNGLSFLVLACAGPQWGKEYGQGQVARGDLVVVLDLSR